MSVHDGHRERMKERFRKTGLDGFEDHEALELLLFYALPRGDINPVAHELIAHFGSFDAVLDAPVDELGNIKGIGQNAATLIQLSGELNRRYEISRRRAGIILDSSEKAGKYLVPFFQGKRDELVYMVCLNSKLKVTNCKEMFHGVVNSASVYVRKLVEFALSNNAVSVIIAHNHIGGAKQPSREDIETTHRVQDAMRGVEITLADHIIVTGDDYISMAESNYFK